MAQPLGSDASFTPRISAVAVSEKRKFCKKHGFVSAPGQCVTCVEVRFHRDRRAVNLMKAGEIHDARNA